MKNIIILADNPKAIAKTLPSITHIFPETGLNAAQIRDFVQWIKKHPQIILTNSLYLIREIDINRIECTWQNFKADGSIIIGGTPDEIGNIAILDANLEQSERYLNKQY